MKKLLKASPAITFILIAAFLAGMIFSEPVTLRAEEAGGTDQFSEEGQPDDAMQALMEVLEQQEETVPEMETITEEVPDADPVIPGVFPEPESEPAAETESESGEAIVPEPESPAEPLPEEPAAEEIPEETDAEEIQEETEGEEIPEDMSEDKAVIVSFTEFAPKSLYITEQVPAEELTAQMPESLEVTLKDGSVVTIPVTWACPYDYENDDDYYYGFFAVTGPEYVFEDETRVPYVMVWYDPESKASNVQFALAGDTVAEQIYYYLTGQMGLGAGASSGILANIAAESSFNPYAYGDGGTSYGICQWHASRFNSLINYCNNNGYDWQGLEGQLHYLDYELRNNYSWLLSNLYAIENSGDGAYLAAYMWCVNFEVPADMENKANTRGAAARDWYYPIYSEKTSPSGGGGGYGAPPTGYNLSVSSTLVYDADNLTIRIEPYEDNITKYVFNCDWDKYDITDIIKSNNGSFTFSTAMWPEGWYYLGFEISNPYGTYDGFENNQRVIIVQKKITTYSGKSDRGEWRTSGDKKYWYENGVKQGTTGRGKEIYDPSSKAWYWLDAIQGGAMAVSKDVYQESKAGKWAEKADGTGKWVRYDAAGHMIKGWYTAPSGKTWYFDKTYGTMAKGYCTIGKTEYLFDTKTGLLLRSLGSVPEMGWKRIDGKDYWYENYARQGISVAAGYRGKEIYFSGKSGIANPNGLPAGWYWLDNVYNGAKAANKEVYMPYTINGKDNIGKWVRYDGTGQMIKGWYTLNGKKYYYDKTTGAMQKGTVTIDGNTYYFDEKTGVLQ